MGLVPLLLFLSGTAVAGIHQASPSELRLRTLSDIWRLARPASPSLLQGSSFVKNLDYKLRLRVCNAYPGEAPFEVLINQATIQKELSYKSCFEHVGDLQAGDNVNFKMSGLASGSFTIDHLPKDDATLILVVQRHDRASMAVSFLSHEFARRSSPQVALLDAFQGSSSSLVEIRPEDQNENAAESLRYNTVMALEEGDYQVVLQRGKGKTEYELSAQSDEAYVMVRCGVNSDLLQSFKEELIIYPSPTEKEEEEPTEKAAAWRTAGDAAAPFMVAIMMLAFRA
mmetsp:Transcript_58823/g.110235  ORF Transcript_58823/g.110235 Transcript_58823/m.110235 type:complete len:284 (+) Transcript_58823:74-925(+)